MPTQYFENYKDLVRKSVLLLHYSDWACTAVMSNDVVKDLRG